MSAAAPLASSSAPPSAPIGPAVPPPAQSLDELHDFGTVRRESIDAARWIARGIVKVTGDGRLGEGTLEGNVTVGGQLSATGLRYQGTLDVGGAMDVRGTFSGSGTLRVGRTFHAGDADLKGTARMLGAASVDRALTVRGSLTTPSLTVGDLSLEGEAHIAGDTLGATVSARLTGDSSFGTVRARSVVLSARPPNLLERVFWRRVTVTAERVEADMADLERVDVEFVRAPQITLGRDTHITQYEGTIVRRHPSSRVGFESKSPPPYGLRR